MCGREGDEIKAAPQVLKNQAYQDGAPGTGSKIGSDSP